MRLAIPCRSAFSTRCCSAKRGTAAESVRGVDLELRPQPVGKPGLLDREILPHQPELVFERDFICLGAAQRAAQHFAELLDYASRGGAVAVAHEHRDGVEAVEEEVRIQLRLQGRQPRAGELLRQADHLDLALVCLDKIPDRVRDPCDRQVNHDAERERDEDPAQYVLTEPFARTDRLRPARRPALPAGSEAARAPAAALCR